MPEADRFVLASAIKSSLAALKAHETRNRKAAKTLTGQNKAEALAKADVFKARQADLIARAGNGKVEAALPAPVAPPQKIEAPAMAIDISHGVGTGYDPEAQEPVVENVPEDEKVVVRQGARVAKAKPVADKRKVNKTKH